MLSVGQTWVIVKLVPTSPNESVESLTSPEDQLSVSDRGAAFTKCARWTLLFGAVGVVALLASLLPLGDLRIAAWGIAYFGGLCVVSFGYVYAISIWRLPSLRWLGFMPPIFLVLIHFSVRLLGPAQFGAIGVIAHVALWLVGLLVGLLLLGAAAGWLAYWSGRRLN
jgi:hypothetical protein